MTATHDEFFNEIKLAVQEDRLLLPSLPEVALKIRDVAENEETTVAEIVDILSRDGSMTARLLKVVNSPLYPSRVPIDDLYMAVTRMGVRMVRDLVMNLAMKQMYQPTSVMMEEQFRKAWTTSVEVASIAQMIAMSELHGIRKEQALLAGLVHNIGALPILLLAEGDDRLFHDQVALDSLVLALKGRVGAMILDSWNFSASLIEVATECHNFEYDHDGGVDLVDLIQFTLLQGGFVNDDMLPEEYSLIPAFSKMGMDADVDTVHIEENQVIIDDTRQSLMA